MSNDRITGGLGNGNLHYIDIAQAAVLLGNGVCTGPVVVV